MWDLTVWDHPNPIFLDFETQSAADIGEIGGRLYAEHESTRILILSMCIDDVYHVWIPEYVRVDTRKWSSRSLWPTELKPHKDVRLYRNRNFPQSLSDILDATTNVTLCAHNAFGFDKHVWERFCPGRFPWTDSLYLARIGGRPGQLDRLGKRVLGIGKDRAKQLLPQLTTATPSLIDHGWCYPIVKPGDLQAFTRYAVADVELVRRLWAEFDNLKVEVDVINTHNSVNDRGIKVDVPLLKVIENVSAYSMDTAADEVAKLTKGKIPPDKLRSTKVMHEWLESYGVYITDEGNMDENGQPKKSLRKEIVQRYLDSPYLIENNLSAVREIPPVVCDVLRLRMKALRITDAKAKRAQQRVSPDGRMRDLISYHVAHTGRFSSSGMQVHNLPNAIKNLDLELLLSAVEEVKRVKDVRKVYDRIQQVVEHCNTLRGEDDPEITVDDALSALIRPCFLAKEGHSFCIADYSAIEARGIAWIADEQKLLHVFRNHGDPYTDFAAKVYGLNNEQIDKKKRQVGKICILGLGYGMGVNKMRIFAANSGVDLAAAGVTADTLVNLYRDTYTRIAGWKPDQESNKYAGFRVGGIWKDLDRAVKDTVGQRQPAIVGKCYFDMVDSDLVCTLPSGREIHYPEARIEDIIPPYVYTMGLPPVPKATVVYTGNYGPKSLFGGLIAENVVQALCRDIMACAMVSLDHTSNPFNIVLDVHDEILSEEPTNVAEQRLNEMLRIMTKNPDWAEGFPISAEGFLSPRFVKKAFKGYKEVHSKHLN